MEFRFSRRDTITLVAVVLSIVVGIGVWPSLPRQMAIHFSATGTPDNYVSRSIGIFLLPIIMVVAYALMKIAFQFDASTDDHVATVTTAATMGLCVTLQVLVLAWNLGYMIPFELVFIGILCWGVGLCGYAFVREWGYNS